ncbi:regulatory signaling modulator protein AmpE, partial [Salmonella enterica subsp. enterica serovar Montevideo]|nr:regulatory signaling modulator protein AmpE [Salmonella enterica subsp. enterica serovar Montevideo]
PVTLVGYAFLRAWQTWLARYQTPHQRLQSGIDAILHVLDWIPTIAAPVVLMGTFSVLYAFGYSINTLTMFAMVLAIGLLVDD